MIDVRSLTKHFGRTVAVDDLSFTVRSGAVTGFLGPNGAGKSTTLRLALGLCTPTRGEVLLAGRRYRDLRRPLREVGALLDATAIDGSRSAHDHLHWLALSQRLPPRVADEGLARVGLTAAGSRRVGTFSLGMQQRLGIAAALLGDPGIVLLDEPMNGLDPDGIRWIRLLLRSLATEGRTVFVSSHMLAELALVADRLVIIGRGRLLADTTTAELTGMTVATTADLTGLGAATRGPGSWSPTALEDAYLALTAGQAEHATGITGAHR